MDHPEARGIYRRQGTKHYWLSYQKNHKRHFVSLETDDFAQAIERAKEVKAKPALNTGGLIEAEVVRYLDWKVASGEFSDDTRANAVGFLRRMEKQFGNIEPERVDQRAAQHYYTSLVADDEMTVGSARTYVAHAASFFTWCVNEAHTVRINPFTEIKNGKVVSRLKMAEVVTVARKEFCEPVLRDKLIRNCPRDDLRFVLYCGFHAGLRRKEVANARPGWFDLARELLHIRKIDKRMAAETGLDPFDLKDREERTIPLSKAFKKFLIKWNGWKGDYCLDPTGRRGLSKYRYDVRRPFDEYMDAQGCGWVTQHTARRTFGSLQVSLGTPLHHVSKWLGDDIRTTINHYGHLMPDHAQLEQGLRGVPRAGSGKRRASPHRQKKAAPDHRPRGEE